MDNIDSSYENNIDYDMDYENNVEDDMNYESDFDYDTQCQECGRKSYYDFCKSCNSVRFHSNFACWTSGDSNLDQLIQNSQLNAVLAPYLIEWIEYSNFENIVLIAHGGFGSVYKAFWKDGPIYEWGLTKSEWHRLSKKKVAIKKFRNVTRVSSELLNEIDANLKMNFATTGFRTVRIYGVTRDPQNGEYAIITEFKNGGNLREMIKNNHSNLTWNIILDILYNIGFGLSSVHEEKYYHKDLHSGNILNSIFSNIIEPTISDFGLCRPMNQSSTDKSPYGVLPFVAPEVLRGGKFTEAADIYGFGVIMSEVISGEPPFVDREYDENLALAICYGQRPRIPEYTPEPYAELMKRCWDPVPANRPTAEEVRREFNELLLKLSKFSNDESSEFNEDKLSELDENESSELDEDESNEFSEEDSYEFNNYLKVKEAFSQEREDKWKARLAELATNPIPLKKSQNLLTSKRLDYSQYLSQKLTIEDWNKLKLTD